MLYADVEERYEAILNLLKFVGILLVGIFLLDELAGRIHVVARIDAHFLAIESSHVGNVRIEVNIGYERRNVPGTYDMHLFASAVRYFKK